MDNAIAQRLTGSLRWGYLAAYLALQHLFAGGLIVVGVRCFLDGGVIAWAIACLFWLVGWWWLVSVWREASRAVTWFRLEGDNLTCRTLGSRRQRVFPLSSMRSIALYYGSGSRRSASGFTLHFDGRSRLGFDFFWLSGASELLKVLREWPVAQGR